MSQKHWKWLSLFLPKIKELYSEPEMTTTVQQLLTASVVTALEGQK